VNTAALGLSLGASVLFAAGLVFTAIGLRYRSARRGAAVSIPTATALFLLIAPFALDLSGFNLKAALIFAAAGIGYPAIVTMLTFEAARRVGPGIAGALGNLTPLFAVIFAVFLLGEVPRPGQAAGIAVIVAGVMLISLPRTLPDGARAALGWAILLPLAGACLRGIIQPGVKAGMVIWPDPFAASVISYVVSASVVMVSAGWGGEPPAASPRKAGIFWFAIVGLCNGFAVMTLYFALSKAPVAFVAPIVASYPLFTLLFGAIVLPRGQGPAGRQVAGIAATVAGIGLLLAL
jgi:drug/metabolite transporter (DMT)-like permease